MRIFLLVILALGMSNAWAYSDGKDQRMIERKTRQLTREAERLARQSERYAARCSQAYVSPRRWKRRAVRLAERGKEYARLCRLVENSGRKAPGSVRMPEVSVKEVPAPQDVGPGVVSLWPPRRERARVRRQLAASDRSTGGFRLLWPGSWRHCPVKCAGSCSATGGLCRRGCGPFR